MYHDVVIIDDVVTQNGSNEVFLYQLNVFIQLQTM